ncbi:MAG: tetratricopeptide repeat protein [Bacteroidetes bacterium]|nr:tetratricopeptide repeat protein [Bacteroidota bacterium]
MNTPFQKLSLLFGILLLSLVSSVAQSIPPTESFFLRGSNFFDAGNYYAATENYAVVTSLNPAHKKSWFNMGLANMHLKNYNKAIYNFEKVIRLEERDGDAFFQKANALFALEKYEEAVGCYTDALRWNADSDAIANRGLALFYLQQYELALEDFELAISFDPEESNYYSLAGDACFELRQHQKAIENYNAAINKNDKDALAYNNRANAKYELRQFSDAAEDYTRAISLQEKSHFFSNRAFCYIHQGVNDLAFQDAFRAVELNPENANANFALGLVKLNQQQFKESIWYFNLAAIHLEGKDAEFHYERGIAFFMYGEYYQATKNFIRAMELDPGMKKANIRLEDCYNALDIENRKVLKENNIVHSIVENSNNKAEEYNDLFPYSWKSGQYEVADDDAINGRATSVDVVTNTLQSDRCVEQTGITIQGAVSQKSPLLKYSDEDESFGGKLRF